MKDSFVVIQSQLNLIEVLMSFVAVYLSLSTCNAKKISGALLAIILVVLYSGKQLFL